MCSVLLCKSVRNITHPPCEKERLRFAGEFFLSQKIFLSLIVDIFSLTELTDLTEPFGAPFEPTERLRHTDITERYCQRRVLGDGCWVLMISKRRMLGDGCWL